MDLLLIYGVTLVAFLAIDAVALKWLLYPVFVRHIGDLLRPDVRFGVAAAFYLIYVAGVLHFAVLPALAAEAPGQAARDGAILGLLAYGTYESTNMATIRGWSWSMLALDVAWGTVLTAVIALIGYGAGRILMA